MKNLNLVVILNLKNPIFPQNSSNNNTDIELNLPFLFLHDYSTPNALNDKNKTDDKYNLLLTQNILPLPYLFLHDYSEPNPLFDKTTNNFNLVIGG